jgi:hypothetical protein
MHVQIMRFDGPAATPSVPTAPECVVVLVFHRVADAQAVHPGGDAR